MIEYCKFHTETHTDDEKKNFDTDFVKVDQATLFELILVRRSLRPARYREEACSRSSRPRKNRAYPNSFSTRSPLRRHRLTLIFASRLDSQAANYMNIKSLLDLTCMTVANMIKGKTPEEIRKTFNIRNDFTPEEEEEVRRENQWAFE